MKFAPTLFAMLAISSLTINQAQAGGWSDLGEALAQVAISSLVVQDGNVQIDGLNGIGRVLVNEGNVAIGSSSRYRDDDDQPRYRSNRYDRYADDSDDDIEVFRAISNTRVNIQDGNVRLRDGFSGTELGIQDGNVRIGNLGKWFAR